MRKEIVARFALLVVGLSLLASQTSALAFNTQAKVVGYGNTPCSKWTESRRSSPQAVKLLETWIAGYLSAFNAWNEQLDQFTDEQKAKLKDIPSWNKYMSELSDITSAESAENIFSYVDIYCRENAQAHISFAVDDTVMKIVMKLQDRIIKENDEELKKMTNDLMRRK
jgi:hypothetical protein